MKDLKYFNTFLDYYNKLINKFKSNNNNIEACTIIDENYTNITTPKGATNIPGKGAKYTLSRPRERELNDTFGTPGKGANSMPMECTSEKNPNKIAAVTNTGESSTFSEDTNEDTVEICKTPSGDKESHFGFGEEVDVELDTVTEEFLELKIRNKEIKKLNEILENYHKKDEKLIKKLKKLKCSNKEYDYFPKLGEQDHDLWDLKTITYDIDINYIHILFFNHYNLNENYEISDRVDGIENGIRRVDGIGNGIYGIGNGIYGNGNGIDGIGRYNIMKIEKMIMKSIENINEMEEILIDKFGIEITKTNINCLFNNNWINDEIINFYLQLLQNHNRVNGINSSVTVTGPPNSNGPDSNTSKDSKDSTIGATTECTMGKGANFTAMECTMGKGANFTAMECTMGKGANFTAMECTMGKGANFMGIECTNERELILWGANSMGMDCTNSTKDGTIPAGPFGTRFESQYLNTSNTMNTTKANTKESPLGAKESPSGVGKVPFGGGCWTKHHVILDCYNYNTFFYERLSVGEMSYDYMSVKRWTRRKKINIFEKDLLFIPINVSKIHWALGVVDMRKKWRRIMLFDSLGGSNPHFFKTIKKYLQDEYKEIFNNTININEWKIRNGYYSEPYAPIQQNTYDCGLFLCQYAKCITFGNKFNFINFNSKFLRNLMIYEILTNNIILIYSIHNLYYTKNFPNIRKYKFIDTNSNGMSIIEENSTTKIAAPKVVTGPRGTRFESQSFTTTSNTGISSTKDSSTTEPGTVTEENLSTQIAAVTNFGESSTNTVIVLLITNSTKDIKDTTTNGTEEPDTVTEKNTIEFAAVIVAPNLVTINTP
ncbi:uncharacterized protein TA07090 [Theileria annulata]|uniref:Ubiquitin-like protease family profile domain-containing protein n=1 Tax=Theileria annulata TaxID=5874 RepID=Q4UAC4_THEAN|nr:uncharacterized protein TA07090 [Theileria annulata]CAI76227.1 hypothetical protein, conserved [Theileria annulata]|eukprot:XP_952852.1 hypothetical protein, conserved [Theileria annulata]